MALLLAAFLADAIAVAPQKEIAPPLVVRLGVDLVQVDVAVTDGKGRPVPDLRAEDFEVRQDGRLMAVSQAVYVGESAREATGGSGAAPRTGGTPPPQATGDVLIFVVDDVALSLRSAEATTRALLRLADGMDPESEVLLLRTARRVADLRPLTGPAELRAAARSLRAAPGVTELRDEEFPVGPTALSGPARVASQYLYRRLAGQSLLNLQDIMDALRGVGGRKTVVLFSEGFPIWDARAKDFAAPLDVVYARGEVLDGVDRLADLANRASVVIHTIDPRGLLSSGVTAQDSVPNPSPDMLSGLRQARQSVLQASQQSLSYVAERTGGIAVTDNNDLASGVAGILSASRAYYLVGFEPDAGTFGSERPRFHELKVRVKRRGLKVRSRKGFYGLTDQAVAALAPPPVF